MYKIGLWLTITPKFSPLRVPKAHYARAPLRGAKQGCPHRPQGAKQVCPVQKSAPRLTISAQTRIQSYAAIKKTEIGSGGGVS